MNCCYGQVVVIVMLPLHGPCKPSFHFGHVFFCNHIDTQPLHIAKVQKSEGPKGGRRDIKYGGISHHAFRAGRGWRAGAGHIMNWEKMAKRRGEGEELKGRGKGKIGEKQWKKGIKIYQTFVNYG